MKIGSYKISLLLLLGIVIVTRFSCVILSNLPFFSMNFIFLYGIAFIFIFFLSHLKLNKIDFLALFFLFCYTFYISIVTIPFYGQIFNNQVFNACIMIFLYFIYLYTKKLNLKHKTTISKFAFFGYLFTWVYSIFKLLQDPTLSRRMAATNMISEIDILGGVGGFDTVYGSILVLCIMIYLLQEKSKINRSFLIFCITSCVLFLILSSYATALVLMLVLFSLYLLKKNKLYFVLMSILFIILFINRVEIGYWISSVSHNFTFSEILSNKINEIGQMLSTGQSAGTLSGDEGRIARMGWSLHTFFKYPLFGGLLRSDGIIGYHSELFDMLGRYGVIGSGLFLSFFILFMKSLYNEIKSHTGKKCFYTVIFIFLCISILNPSLYTQEVLPLFILLPIFDSYIQKGDFK